MSQASSTSSPVVSIRTTCRACSGDPLEKVLDLGEQEVITLGDKPSVKVPLVLTKCTKCALVQLDRTVDREFLFRQYYYRSGTNQTMRNHLKGVVEDVMKRVELWAGDIVIDIGANDGTLLQYYPLEAIKVGFEPANIESPWMNVPNLHIFRDFFTRYQTPNGKKQDFPNGWSSQWRAKVITAISMFYDLDDPNAFLRDVKKVLAPDGLFVVEMAYLPTMLRENTVDNICHEHLCYYSLTTFTDLLNRNGFQVEDVEFSPINGGVFRCYIRHSKGMFNGGKVAEVLTDEIGLDQMPPYRAFKLSVELNTIRLQALMRGHGDKTFDVIGASTRGATIVQLIGHPEWFRFAVERNPDKVGKTYCGLPIVSEETFRQNPPDYALVLPYSFGPEIEARYRDLMLKGLKLVYPAPEPYIVEARKL